MSKQSRRAVICGLLITIAAGCQQQRRSVPTPEAREQAADEDRWKRTDEAVVNTLREGVSGQHAGVTHVVLCWLKTPGDAAQRQKLIDESFKFRQIPGVVNVTAGPAIPSTRPVVDSSFDVAVVITFADEAAMKGYEEHPIHKKAVSDVLKPLTAKIVIYDVKHAKAGVTSR